MFKQVLVPVDGSATAGKAIDKAVAIALAFQSVVTVIHVIDPFPPAGSTGAVAGPVYCPVAAADMANAAISNARKAFEACGVAVKSSVVEGFPVYQAILEAAETLDADLVVMGSHGRRRLEKLILGSVTAQVLSHAHLAVLVVRG